MAEDRYTRQDNRSYCDVYGHDYREVNCQTRRWTEKEEIEDGQESVYSSYVGCYTGETRQKYRTIRVKHAIDIVTYECSHCGTRITRKENER